MFLFKIKSSNRFFFITMMKKKEEEKKEEEKEKKSTFQKIKERFQKAINSKVAVQTYTQPGTIRQLGLVANNIGRCHKKKSSIGVEILEASTASAVEGDSMPSGCLIKFPKHVPIDRDLVKPNICAVQVACRLEHENVLTKKEMRRFEEAVRCAIMPKEAREPLLEHASIISGGRDNVCWDATLQTGGGYVGLYANNNNRSNNGKQKLLLICHCNGTAASKQVYDTLEPDSMSLTDFTQSDAYRTLKQLNFRNAARLLYNVASAYGLDSKITVAKDLQAADGDSEILIPHNEGSMRRAFVEPMLAVPDYVNEINVYTVPKNEIDQEFVNFYAGIVDPSSSKGGYISMTKTNEKIRVLDKSEKLASVEPLWPAYPLGESESEGKVTEPFGIEETISKEDLIGGTLNGNGDDDAEKKLLMKDIEEEIQSYDLLSGILIK